MLGIDPMSEDNRFQQVFYNKFPELPKTATPQQRNEALMQRNILKDHIPKFQSHNETKSIPAAQPQDQPLTQNVTVNVPTNLDLWINSYD